MKKIHETFRVHLGEQHYRDMIARYHFKEEDLAQLERVGKFAGEAARPELFCGLIGALEGDRKQVTNRLAVVVTLGSGFDELQERYMKKERLSEGYMLECIGMELLRNAYEQAAVSIWLHTGMWISGFEFLGDREPLSRMEEIFQKIQPQGIQYNQAYMLKPKKTVVFLTDLCLERKDSYCHVCADCGNMNCPNRTSGEKENGLAETKMHTTESSQPVAALQENRKLTYGYQRIFGDSLQVSDLTEK